MISIICNSLNEVTCLMDEVEILEEHQNGCCHLLRVKYKNKQFIITETGYGKVNVGYALAYLGSLYNINAIIGIGYGISINCPNINLFDIAIANSTVLYDVNFTAIGYEQGLIPGLNTSIYYTNQRLIDKAIYSCNSLNYQAYLGRFASGDTLVTSKEQIDFISSFYQADFIDLNSGSYGEIAYIQGIPFLSIISIINLCENDNNILNNNINKALNKVCKVVLKMINNI